MRQWRVADAVASSILGENMHGFIREELENLVASDQTKADCRELAEHLDVCSECSAELKCMRHHAELLKTLRANEELEPSPGFYARVLQRIEERTKDSIWAFFIYSPFGKRLVYASLTLAVLLGTYVVSRESGDGHLNASDSTAVVQQADEETPVTGNQSQQRDAVLVNFASYEGPIQ